MKTLQEYIKDKSVCFVGMAPILMGKGTGEEINSFDVVCRTNVFPIPADYQKDYGTKGDVISMLYIKRTNPKIFAENGVKWVIWHTVWKTNKRTPPLSDEIKYYQLNERKINEIRAGISREIGFDPRHPSAGASIIYTVLQSQPKRLKLFGITGYQDKNGNVVDYFKGTQHYIPYFKSKIRPGIVSMEHHPSHNFQVQNDWIRYLLKNGRVEMDPYSLEYFKYN